MNLNTTLTHLHSYKAIQFVRFFMSTSLGFALSNAA